MNFNYDSVADSAYFTINKGKVKRTIEMLNNLIVDIGQKGQIIGIEILNFSQNQIKKTSILKLVKSGIPLSISKTKESLPNSI